MKYKKYLLILVVITIFSIFTFYNSKDEAKQQKEEIAPAHIEHSEDGKMIYVKLTQRASERIGIETIKTSYNQKKIPYSSIIYDLNGKTWVYVSSEPLTYVRKRANVYRVSDFNAFLSKPLPVDTNVVIQGVPELFGVENGIGEGGGH